MVLPLTLTRPRLSCSGTDLLAPIVMVLAKSNPRGLRSLASLVDDGACDSPSAQMGDEGLHPTPPPLTTALLVRGKTLPSPYGP